MATKKTAEATTATPKVANGLNSAFELIVTNILSDIDNHDELVKIAQGLVNKIGEIANAKSATKATAKKATSKKAEKPTKVAVGNTQTIKDAGLTFVEYKSGYVLGGDTKPLKDKLKELGGRYNAFMKAKNNGSWFFRKEDYEKAKKALKIA